MNGNINIWIIGLGLFGYELTKKLLNNGFTPCIVDTSNDKLMKFKNTDSILYLSNTEEKNEIEELGIEKDATILVTLGHHIQSSILTCQNLLELDYKNIFVQITSDSHEKIIKSIGITNIIRPYKILSDVLFMRIVNKIEIITTGSKYSIVKIINNHIWTKSLEELNLRKKYDLNIILIDNKNGTNTPTKNTLIKKNDIITLLMPNDKISKIKKLFNN